MAIELMELQHIEDADADVGEPRTLASIRRDLDDLADDPLTTPELYKVRRSLSLNLSGVTEGGDAWRGVVDEFEPELDRCERDAITRLERARAKVLSDRQHLTNAPYRCGLPASQAEAAEVKAAMLSSRLPTMTAVDVQRAIKSAVLFGDQAEQAAWASLGPDLEARFPSTQRVRDEAGKDVYPAQLFRDPMRQAEARTGDRQVLETRDRIEGQLRRVNEEISAISSARNAHNPTGGVGGVLASYQFGRGPGGAEQVRKARRYDPAAVRARIGR